MAQDDPFTPGFGVTPPVMVSAGQPVADFAHALAAGRPSSGLNVLVSGPRGTGKTVLLTQMEGAAREAGWSVITLHTASADMVSELRGEVAALLRDLDPDASTSHLSSVQVSAPGGFGVGGSREPHDRYADQGEPLGRLLERAARLASAAGGGMVVAIDEVQSAHREQLYEVTQHLQDLVRHGHRVGLVAAGIRGGVEELLAEDKTTFLRRAHRVETGSVDVGSAAEVIRQTIAGTSKMISPEAAVAAGEISQGYPYLIQVVGSLAWTNSGDESEIALEDVQAARRPAIAQMIKNVHQPALRDVSGRKMDYLVAMLEDAGPSPVAELASRMGTDVKYQSVYRDRLIRDELIRPAGRGYVEFALPYLREAVIDKHMGGGVHNATTNTTTITRTTPTTAPAVHRSPGRDRGAGYGR